MLFPNFYVENLCKTKQKEAVSLLILHTQSNFPRFLYLNSEYNQISYLTVILVKQLHQN